MARQRDAGASPYPLTALLCALWLAGCAETPAAAGQPGPLPAPQALPAREAGADAAPRSDAAALEPSVRPDINAPYFAPGALEKFTGVLEAESREVVQHKRAIVAALGLSAGDRVADVGAGTGLFTLALARQVGSQGQVIAVDIVPAFLAKIASRARRAGLSNVSTLLAGERGLSLPDQSIDLAFLCDVYHHLEYPASYLASLRRALRPRGRLVVIDFKRIEGVTKPAVLAHVRAGQEVVTREIERAGFHLLARQPHALRENYLLIFEPSP